MSETNCCTKTNQACLRVLISDVAIAGTHHTLFLLEMHFFRTLGMARYYWCHIDKTLITCCEIQVDRVPWITCIIAIYIYLIFKIRYLANRVISKHYAGLKGILKEFFCLPCLAGRRQRQKSRRGPVGAPLPCVISLDLTVLKPTPGFLFICTTLDAVYGLGALS